MEIYLIRHTKPDVPINVCYGQSDIGVAASFQQELASIQKQFDKNDKFLVYSSPLKRCQLLAEALSLSWVHLDDRLKELDFGEWELKEWNRLDQQELSKWGDDFVNMCVPGGESCQEMYERSISFFKELSSMAGDQEQEKKVAIVTHGGVIRSILVHVLGMPLENMFRLGIDYGSVSGIDVNQDMMTVKFFNFPPRSPLPERQRSMGSS